MRRRNGRLIVWIFVAAAALNTACTTIGMGMRVAEIKAPVAHVLMLDSRQVIVLDFRPAGDYETGHLQGALSIPLEEIDTEIERLELLKQSTMLVYDADEQRSIQGANRLLGAGFANVVRIQGGLGAWIEARLPTVSSAGVERGSQKR